MINRINNWQNDILKLIIFLLSLFKFFYLVFFISNDIISPYY